MKIGFFGTPAHSAELLEVILSRGHEVVFVATNPDKPFGREKKLQPSPVKELALKHNIPVLQFESLKTEGAISAVNSYTVDINIIFACGFLIPRAIFDHPPLGTVNMHGSLLPEYRGASPVQSALLDGKKVSGASIQYIVEELDAGDIVSKVEVEILPEDNAGTLLTKITEAGTKIMLELLDTKPVPTAKFPSIPQDSSKATHCKKIKPEDRKLDLKLSAESVLNKIRAFNPGYTPFCIFREKRINIYSAKKFTGEIQKSGNPGTVHVLDKKSFGIECGDGGILILESVQPENKKVMSAADFMNGSKPSNGELFL